MINVEEFKPLNLSSANGGVKAFHWARRTFILIFLFTVFGISITIWPYHPVDYKYIVIENPQVHAGDVLKYRLYFKKYNSLTPSLSRKLISVDNPEDDTGVQATTMGMSEISKEYKRIYIGIPVWLKPGKYFVRVRVIYPYWGGNIPVGANYRTPEFDVVASDTDKKNKIINSFIEREKARDKIESIRDKDYTEKTRIYEQRNKVYKEWLKQ